MLDEIVSRLYSVCKGIGINNHNMKECALYSAASYNRQLIPSLVSLHPLDPLKFSFFTGFCMSSQFKEDPFVYDEELSKSSARIVDKIYYNDAKPKAVFNWMQNNIKARKMELRYKNAVETFKSGYGNCYELAVLYTTMMRIIGFDSGIALVDIDSGNRKVSHACSTAVDNKNTILVDPAYHTYDIKHLKYEIISDEKVASIYRLCLRKSGNS